MMEFVDAFDCSMSLIATVLFYTLTNSAPSTRGILSEFWEKVEGSRHGQLKVFIAENLGVGLRCLFIWIAAIYLIQNPELNLYVALIIFGYAILFTLNKTIHNVKAPKQMSALFAFFAIILGEVALNLDNVVATTVDSSLDALTISLVLFWVLVVGFKALHLDQKVSDWVGNKLNGIENPRTWWSKQSFLFKSIAALSCTAIALVVLPIYPLAWRTIQGIRKTYKDREEFQNAVWVFILVLLGVMSVFDIPEIAAICLPLNILTSKWLLSTFDLKLSFSGSHEVLKILSGVFVSLSSAFLFSPIFEARVLNKDRHNTKDGSIQAA